MASYKSSPLILDHPITKPRKSHRKISKNASPNTNPYRVRNPFLHKQEEDHLPPDLQHQLLQMDYLSPHHIQTINFSTISSSRRSSPCTRHLQSMQNAAKKQEQMYQSLLSGETSQHPTATPELLKQQTRMSIEADERSTHPQDCFFDLHEDPTECQPFPFLHQEIDQDDIIYYSQNYIPDSPLLKDDYEAYFYS